MIGLPLVKYETVEDLNEKKHKNALPILQEYNEFKAFGDKLMKLPQRKAEAFVLIENIINTKADIDNKAR